MDIDKKKIDFSVLPNRILTDGRILPCRAGMQRSGPTIGN